MGPFDGSTAGCHAGRSRPPARRRSGPICELQGSLVTPGEPTDLLPRREALARSSAPARRGRAGSAWLWHSGRRRPAEDSDNPVDAVVRCGCGRPETPDRGRRAAVALRLVEGRGEIDELGPAVAIQVGRAVPVVDLEEGTRLRRRPARRRPASPASGVVAGCARPIASRVRRIAPSSRPARRSGVARRSSSNRGRLRPSTTSASASATAAGSVAVERRRDPIVDRPQPEIGQRVVERRDAAPAELAGQLRPRRLRGRLNLAEPAEHEAAR